MSRPPGRLLLVFLDGVGIGSAEPGVNPWLGARLPVFEQLFGGRIPVLEDDPSSPVDTPLGSWIAADATLGIPGRPQSGTGQTSLLTGENAAAAFGRHFGPWVPTPLRAFLSRRNLLSRAREADIRAAFANAHPSGEPPAHAIRRPAAPPFAAAAAGLLVRHEEALRAGHAVASSITNEGWRRYLPDLRSVTPAEAGANLASISREAELTLFAHYDTDLIGHRRDLRGAVAVLERVDSFLGGLLDSLPEDALLVIASDHGNIEDASVGHTTNPVPVIAAGPSAAALVRGIRSITDVTPGLLTLLNVE